MTGRRPGPGFPKGAATEQKNTEEPHERRGLMKRLCNLGIERPGEAYDRMDAWWSMGEKDRLENPETCPPVVREMRLELTRLGCQNLNLVRLPIPPLPRKNKNSNETNPTQLTGVT